MLDALPVPRVVAFDLDGTLVDSRGDIAAACNHALAWSGRAPLSPDAIATFVGDGARMLLARATGLERGAPELERLLDELLRHYAAHPVELTTWMPGALELMTALEERDVRLALVTNKARVVTVEILRALGVSDRFALIYAGGDGPLKPSPEPLLRVMRALASTPRETWIIGDGIQDVGAGIAAGCTTIAVLGGFHSEDALRAAGASLVVPSLVEIDRHVRRAAIARAAAQ